MQTVTTIGLDITKSVLHVAITEPLFRPVATDFNYQTVSARCRFRWRARAAQDKVMFA